MHDVPGAEHAISGGMEFGGWNRGLGANGDPTEPTPACTETAQHALVGTRSVVAVQTAAAAKGSNAGVGSFVCADVTEA
jgi:hypothetical protein